MTPSSLTFLTTYRCTAACAECCFQSSPLNPSRTLRLDECVHIIDQAVEEFGSLRLIVFSGGECFLLGNDLFRAIAHAGGRNKLTRCVSNGYWGKQQAHACRTADALATAGLTEINFSTGDDHQCFVPLQSVINAAIACAGRDIRTLIVVEGHSGSQFRLEGLLAHPDLTSFLVNSPKRGNLQVMQNIWIPFNTGRTLEHPDVLELHHRIHEGGETGCNQILHNLVITPDLQLACCCGLTLEYIDELKLGRVGNNLRSLYESQSDDFMKIWLSADGPQKILEFARTRNPAIDAGIHSVHPCQACALLFNDQRVRQALSSHYLEVIDDVMLRFHLKQERQSYGLTSDEEKRHVPA